MTRGKTRRSVRFRDAVSLRVRALVLLGIVLLAALTLAQAQNPLVTGKKITLPALGVQQNVGSLPMNMILTPDRRFAITTDMGFRQSLWSIDTGTGLGLSHIFFPGGAGVPNPTNAPAANGLYYGLAIAGNGDGTSTLYAAQGANDSIAVVKVSAAGALTQTGTIAATKNDFPSGLALDQRGYLYVANNDPSTFAAPCSLAIYNASTGTQVGRFVFSGGPFGPNNTPNFPLAVASLADGSKTYVSSQRDGMVYVLDTHDPTNPTLASAIPSGAHPDALLLNKAQTRLFIANAHSDTVTVVNTATDMALNTLLLRPTGATTLAGATPTGLALSPDEARLYATLGDMNAVAVVNLGSGKLEGYIPTGWYPTAVAVTPLKKMLVANAKGTTTRYPNPGYTLSSFNGNPHYDHNMIEGSVSTFGVPTPRLLSTYTAQVVANNRIASVSTRWPVADLGLAGAGKIKHVIYIVKENRTYDQVLGDLPQGNGNPALVLFGNDVTPNQHALAQRFVLLDNFYDCGEASGDGWPWSTQGIATEYVIKDLPYNYSGRGRNYDFEGQDNGYLTGGFPAVDPYGNPLSAIFPAGLPPIVDVAEAPAHHIWDVVQAAGLPYRNYGFFYSFGVANILPDNFPASAGLQPAGHDLGGISDFDYRRYDNDYPDSDAPLICFNQSADPNCLYAKKAYGHYHMPSRFSEWNREFQEMLAADPTGGSVPAFMTVRFNHDHTQGFSSGKHTPKSEVADNDYAVGQLVEAISNSPIWNSAAIFILEDDAQDGPDHVDAHRSTCYVISPWIKKGSVDHTFYNTDSVLKTIELLLGVAPMSQYDGVATPILDWDASASNSDLYSAILPSKDIIARKNPSLLGMDKKDPRRKLVAASDRMDFDHPDSAPAQMLNEIVWKSVKGVDSQMPAPRHSMVAMLDGDGDDKTSGAARHTGSETALRAPRSPEKPTRTANRTAKKAGKHAAAQSSSAAMASSARRDGDD